MCIHTHAYESDRVRTRDWNHTNFLQRQSIIGKSVPDKGDLKKNEKID